MLWSDNGLVANVHFMDTNIYHIIEGVIPFKLVEFFVLKTGWRNLYRGWCRILGSWTTGGWAGHWQVAGRQGREGIDQTMDLGHKNLLILPHLLQSNANADQIIEIQQQRTHAIRLHCSDKIRPSIFFSNLTMDTMEGVPWLFACRGLSSSIPAHLRPK